MLKVNKARVAVLAGAGLLLLWGVPRLIPLNDYKDRMAAQLSTKLGRTVRLDGSVHAALLPLPHLSAEGLHVSDGGREVLSARSLSLRPSWIALLSGHLEPASLSVAGGTLHPPSAENSAAWVEEIDGWLTLGNDGQNSHNTFSATATVRGVPLSLKGSLTGEDAVFTLALVKQNAQAHFEGRLSADHTASGRLQAQGDSLPALATALGYGSLRLPSGGASITGQMALDSHHLSVDKASLAIAGLEGQASVDAAWDNDVQVDAAIAFSRMDLDRWAASLPPPPTASTTPQTPAPAPADAKPQTAAAPPQESSPAAAPAAPSKETSAFPDHLTLTLDMTAEHITLHGADLTGAKAELAMANGDLLIHQASVHLPGQGEANLYGFFTPGPAGMSFDGNLTGHADDLRGFLGWLNTPLPPLAEDRLRHGEVSLHFLADRQAITMDNGKLGLDGAQTALSGSLQLSPRPILGVSVSTDSLNLDSFLPPTSPPTKTSQPPQETPAPSAKQADEKPKPTEAPKAEGVIPPPARSTWLTALETNLKAKLGTLTTHGMTAHDVQADLSWQNGDLTIRTLGTPDLEGAQVGLSGGIGLKDGAMRRLHWEIRSDKPGKLVKALGGSLPPEAEKMGALALTGSADGRLTDGLAVDGHLEMAGGQMAISGRIDHPLNDPALHLSANASHASLTQLLRLSAPDYRPQAPLGDFAASVIIDGPASAVAFNDLRLKLGPVVLAGQAKLSKGTARPRLDVKMTAGEIPVDNFLPTRRTGALPPPADAPQLIPAKSVSFGHAAGGGDQPPAPAAAPRPKVIISGLSDHWSAEPLDLSWLTTLDAAVQMDAQAVTWNGSRFDKPTLSLELQDGSAQLSRLTAALWNGALSITGALADNGAAKLDASLSHGQIRDAMSSLSGLSLADGQFDGEASLTAKGKSVADMVAHLNGGIKAQARDGMIKGFDLKSVDAQARDLSNPLGLLGLLQAGLSGGATHYSSLSGTARIKDGIVQSDDLTLVADGGGAKGELIANLPTWAMDAHAAFHLASSPDAPPLVMRLTGSLDNPRRFIDINAIQGWLAQKGFGAKGPLKDAGDALGKMMTGQRNDDGSKVKAKDVVKGLLKGLR